MFALTVVEWHAFGFGPVLQFFAVLVYFLFVGRLMASTTHELDQELAKAVLTTLTLAEITRKEAATAQGLDEAQFNRQLRCESHHHISLNRLIRLPWKFWLFFGPTLAYIVARKRYAEIAEDFTVKERI